MENQGDLYDYKKYFNMATDPWNFLEEVTQSHEILDGQNGCFQNPIHLEMENK